MNRHTIRHHIARACALALAGSLCCAVTGCGGDDDDSTGTSNGTTSNGTTATSNGTTATSNGTTATSNGTTATSNGATGPTATFATYNVGLARGFVDFAEERLEPLVAAISTSDADVLCIQEAWLVQDGEGWSQEQIDTLVSGTASAFPHSYFQITMPTGDAALCTQEEIDSLGSCALANCGEVPQGELTSCVLGMCGTEFAATSSACQGCAAANLGKPLQEILDSCSPAVTLCTQAEIDSLGGCALDKCGEVPQGELTSCVLGMCGTEFSATSSACQGCAAANLGKPLQEILDSCSPGATAGSAYAYNGHNGLLLLSKHALAATDIREFPSALTYRSALHAKITIPTFGDVDVYCTHIAADLSGDIAYPSGGDYTSFEEENAAQVAGLADFISTATTGNVVLMGDFNTGPTKAGNKGELEANYTELLATTGLSSPYADQAAPLCTFCPDNTLVRSADGHVLDHILIGIPTQTAMDPSRIFDQTQSITTSDGAMDLNLSDHYGVSVKVTVSP